VRRVNDRLAAAIAKHPTRFAGFGAELAATVMENCFWNLEAPIQRVAGFDTIMPLFKLEHDYIPGVQRIIDAVERTFTD